MRPNQQRNDGNEAEFGRTDQVGALIDAALEIRATALINDDGQLTSLIDILLYVLAQRFANHAKVQH